MSDFQQKFFDRFLQYPLPVIFAAFYMWIVWDAYTWMKTLDDPKQAEWIMNGLVAGAVGYFKFYTDLIMKNKGDS